MTSPDIQKYRRYVDHFDLTEEQKVELIRTVWRIMESFVHRAFGVDPVQQLKLPAPGKDAIGAANVVPSGLRSRKPKHLADAFRLSAGKRRRRKKCS